MTLHEALQQYPDAVEVNINSQAAVSQNMAIKAAYGRVIETKLLFSRSIFSTRQVKNYYIFSVMALEEEKEVLP